VEKEVLASFKHLGLVYEDENSIQWTLYLRKLRDVGLRVYDVTEDHLNIVWTPAAPPDSVITLGGIAAGEANFRASNHTHVLKSPSALDPGSTTVIWDIPKPDINDTSALEKWKSLIKWMIVAIKFKVVVEVDVSC